MGKKLSRGQTGNFAALEIALGLLFAAWGWLVYYGILSGVTTIAAGAGILALLWLGDLRRLLKLPSLLLLAHAAFMMLTIFWAASGKFFLERYSATFVAVFFFLFAVLRGRGSAVFAERAASVCAVLCAAYALLSVEAASTGVVLSVMNSIAPEDTRYTGMSGGRLTGVFTNSNLEASFFAMGILLSIALICAAGEKKKRRARWAFTLVCCAYAMLLGVSVGALACFGVAVIVCLLAAREERAAMLTRMLLGAAFAFAGVLVWTALAHSSPDASEWIVMLVFAAAAAAVEFFFGERVCAALASHERATIGAAVGAVALALAYLIAGANITGAYTFRDGETITRSVVLQPGEQTITVDADEGVTVGMFSRTDEQIMTYDRQSVFTGDARKLDGATVDVREGKTICEFTFTGAPGAQVRSVVCGKTKIPLNYVILPEFISRRLVNLSGSSSLQQRLVFVRDSMKLFRLAPLAGKGSGAFAAVVAPVQSFEYSTVHSHNQYVEALVEGGVIDFTLFAGAVVTLGAALFRARGKERKEGWLYPMLCAEFTMSALQMLWDATMIMTVFQSMVFLLYGVIAETCGEPVARKESGAAEKESQTAGTAARLACCVLPLLFAVSVGCNLYAKNLMNSKAETLDEFMTNLESAQKWDLYEKNDAKLSYVRAEIDYDLDEGIYREKADRYAKELSGVQSNTTHYLLTVYYLNTGRYYEAIAEATTAAEWTPSDSGMWNECIDALKQAFIDSGEYSPLLDGKNELLTKLLEYEELFRLKTARLIKPVELDDNSRQFFAVLDELAAVKDDPEAFRAVLVS
ncbi:MAG: O-antigen ligase family protein [Oscillospiraceae bacterium]|nr:O-antigen ligase family protein [Oscillospiraceae bacterium]